MDVELYNGGDKPLLVPGLGVDIDYQQPDKKRFSHGMSDWMQDSRLTARELSMLRLMDALTDKPDWNKKVFDDETVEKWHLEASEMPLISEAAWCWCLSELRDKAEYFNDHGFTLTLDTGSRCAKSDTVVSPDLQRELAEAVAPLLRRSEKDWHPNSNEQVLNQIHPSLFPLVYGRTRVLETGSVDLHNCVKACGQGCIAPSGQHVEDDRPAQEGRFGDLYNAGHWSIRFQWLPCEVKFVGDTGTEVRIASYINNLHPDPNKALYTMVEKLVGKSIPLWNATLITPDHPLCGRTSPRIHITKVESDPAAMPEWSWNISARPKGDEQSLEQVRQYLALPDAAGIDHDKIGPVDEYYLSDKWETLDDCHGAVAWKFRRIRKILHPEPGFSIKYKDWKAGNDDHHSLHLERDFRDRGLQVIVKLASIELTPEKPHYAGGSWHLEGMLNEHIVGTSIYYYDVENVTESRIRFRQEANLEIDPGNYEQDDHGPFSEVFGTDKLGAEPAIQELGSIATPHGRLLCFPNTLQHKVEPFQLADNTKPGHRRALVLWLVDPHYRITSTANVPPQRHDWWEPHGLRRVMLKSGLPVELQDLVREEVGEWPMGMEEAKRLRLELMAERTNLMPTVEANLHQYNFCEH